VRANDLLVEPRLPVVRMLGREERDLLSGFLQEPVGLEEEDLSATRDAEELMH